MSCDKAHQKRRAKLPVNFGNAELGTIVEVEICPYSGVKVKSKQLGLNDEGFYTISSTLAKVIVD